MSILEGEIAQIVGEALIDADLPYEITITRAGEPLPRDNEWDPIEYGPPQTFTCQGFVDDYSIMLVSQGVVQADDRKVNIITGTLATDPRPNDGIVAQGRTLTVLGVNRDPAGALWELHCR